MSVTTEFFDPYVAFSKRSRFPCMLGAVIGPNEGQTTRILHHLVDAARHTFAHRVYWFDQLRGDDCADAHDATLRAIPGVMLRDEATVDQLQWIIDHQIQQLSSGQPLQPVLVVIDHCNASHDVRFNWYLQHVFDGASELQVHMLLGMRHTRRLLCNVRERLNFLCCSCRLMDAALFYDRENDSSSDEEEGQVKSEQDDDDDDDERLDPSLTNHVLTNASEQRRLMFNMRLQHGADVHLVLFCQPRAVTCPQNYDMFPYCCPDSLMFRDEAASADRAEVDEDEEKHEYREPVEAVDQEELAEQTVEIDETQQPIVYHEWSSSPVPSEPMYRELAAHEEEQQQQPCLPSLYLDNGEDMYDESYPMEEPPQLFHSRDTSWSQHNFDDICLPLRIYEPASPASIPTAVDLHVSTSSLPPPLEPLTPVTKTAHHVHTPSIGTLFLNGECLTVHVLRSESCPNRFYMEIVEPAIAQVVDNSEQTASSNAFVDSLLCFDEDDAPKLQIKIECEDAKQEAQVVPEITPSIIDEHYASDVVVSPAPTVPEPHITTDAVVSVSEPVTTATSEPTVTTGATVSDPASQCVIC